MRDFSIEIYLKLLTELKMSGYKFQTFKEFLEKPKEKVVILRHDVDLLPKNSLRFARIQNELGINGTYYFRAVPESWDVDIIKKISELGHEIGYHYESLTTCKGDLNKGIFDFEKNLIALRKIAPVSTICMHGSPMSKYDSKDLWINFDYRKYKIIGEPYFDVDFNDVFYLTDTGRRWDGQRASVRDIVATSYKDTFHSTKRIISALDLNKLPNHIMFTFHPQRWHTSLLLWINELVLQNVKNVIKRLFFVSR